jgi:outer membrane protein assembly factor BamB
MTDMRLKHKVLSDLLTGSLAVCALAMVWYVLSHNPTKEFVMDLPGADGTPDVGVPARRVDIGEFFATYDGVRAGGSASWPGFRGVSRDNRLDGEMQISLPPPMASGEPTLVSPLWKVSLGEGHAGAAVHDGRVYVLDYDEDVQADALRCFSLADGREIWRRWYTIKTKRNHGVSRTIPAVTDDYVVSIGPQCQVMCVDAKTGDYLWGIDLVTDFGVDVPLWYTGQCPLIEGDQAIIAVGGVNLLMGIDCGTGEILWTTPNSSEFGMSHSSVITMDIHGTRTYVYAAIGGIVGVSAEPEDRGTLLWVSTDFDAKVIAPSPVYVGDGLIFSTAGYGAGSILIRVDRSAGDYQVETVYRTRPTEGFSCEQQTPLVSDGYLYGILTKDAGPLREQFVCYDPAGRIIWSSGEKNRFGLGPYLFADGKLLILRDDGVLILAEAGAERYRELGQARILTGVDAWAPMALVDGKLIARDSNTMVCVDLVGL